MTVLAALLAGLPWALVRMVGSPLPDHLPTWADVHGVLLEPLTATVLLDVLACACWLLWAVFTVNVGCSALDIVRHARLPDPWITGPIRRTAAVLVTTLLISLLGHRAALATGSESSGHTATTVLAAEPLRETGRSVTVRVPDPNSGVHDSLWRIAERTLGDGNRWPEIFALNKGKPQPGGRTLTQPSRIYPGETLRLPEDTHPDNPPTTPPPPTPAPPQEPAPTTTPAPTSPTTTPRTTPASTGTVGEPGIRWGEEVFVGLGLAAAVSTALVIARRRRRRHYRPGSGDRTDLRVAPVVYQLRLAHLRTEPDTAPETPSASQLGLGVRDGREIALNLAAAHGLGLIGAGAPAAMRALVVSALAATQHRPGARLIVPAADLAILVDRTPSPSRLHVVADLDAALDDLETEILIRANAPKPAPDGWPPLLLIARAPGRQRQRLQAILDNGTTVGVTGLLLGQWPSGATAYVRENGTISTTNPGLGEPLRGTRVFRLGVTDTTDLLTLLRDADPDHDPRTHRTAVTADPDLEIVDDASATGQNLSALPTASLSSADGPATSGDPDRRLASPSTEPLKISVLGPPRVWWRGRSSAPSVDTIVTEEREITSALQPRVRELLVFLALHPDGATREALIAALWPTSPAEKTTNAMNTGLTRLRRAVAGATEGAVPNVMLSGDGRYRLDPALVEVDYHRFATAVAARRTARTDHERINAYRSVVDSYTGPLADGLSTEWIETAREAIRRDAIDAVAALARALVDHDPQQTLDLLEVARAFDPHNELIYRDIMRLQERLGQLDAIPRTLTLLTTRLAEVDDHPTRQALDLAERLRNRGDAEFDETLRGHTRAG